MKSPYIHTTLKLKRVFKRTVLVHIKVLPNSNLKAPTNMLLATFIVSMFQFPFKKPAILMIQFKRLISAIRFDSMII